MNSAADANMLERSLRCVPWLASASAQAMDLLVTQASVVVLPRQTCLFVRGQPVQRLWVVTSGRLELGRVTVDGKRFVAAMVPPGEAVGFIPLLDGGSAIHDALAAEPTTVVGVPQGALLAAMQADAALLQSMLRLLLQRGRRLNEWRSEALVRPLPARLARLLAGLARAIGRPGATAGLELALTQDDLAAMLGATRQALNPEIKAFERQGWVSLGYKRVNVLDADALEQLANEAGG